MSMQTVIDHCNALTAAAEKTRKLYDQYFVFGTERLAKSVEARAIDSGCEVMRTGRALHFYDKVDFTYVCNKIPIRGVYHVLTRAPAARRGNLRRRT